MLAKVLSSAVSGIEAYPVEVEVDIANGLPAVNIVGLPDTACRESMDRVRAALKNSGLSFPTRRVTVNLAPADLKKEGPGFDLAIALGVLVASEELPAQAVRDKVFCGELSLDGKVRGVAGILPRAAALLGEEPRKSFVFPQVNAKEVIYLKGLTAYPVRTLEEVIHFLKSPGAVKPLEMCDAPEHWEVLANKVQDFSDIKGQRQAKRGLEIAAAGGHNVLSLGTQCYLIQGSHRRSYRGG